MNSTDKAKIADAVKRANEQLQNTNRRLNAIYVDLLIDDEKIGRLVSCGHGEHRFWSFVADVPNRRHVRTKSLDEVIPKWAAEAILQDPQTELEMFSEEAKKKQALIDAAHDRLYNALESDAFPCNPIPFATGLADHVREHGTDSIKSDQAKRILWILMAQAYGQLAKIDLSDEWDRLCEK